MYFAKNFASLHCLRSFSTFTKALLMQSPQIISFTLDLQMKLAKAIITAELRQLVP